MIEFLATIWPPLLATLQLLLAAVASAHVVLHKRDVRAAIGWTGLIWLVPLAGAVLYGLFGINRIRRRASGLRTQRGPVRHATRPLEDVEGGLVCLPPDSSHLRPVARLMNRITDLPLVPGNSCEPLVQGEEAYAAMLHAIDLAERSVGLVTYIFEPDAQGSRFVDALARAQARGVAVRVLIDGVGAYYARASVTGALRRQNIPCAEFLPSPFPLSLHYANLRNHRKILVVDGRIGFAGGMNIRAGHMAAAGAAGIQDVQFHLEGLVVAHLAEAFADDWEFATGERLSGQAWFPSLVPAGPVVARGIAAGPDEAFERVRWMMLAALSQARDQVRIVTPYFLPDTALSTALQLAALRGVAVDIAIPERSNLRLMQWASQAKLVQFIARGCRIWLTAPPFDHSKLMTVDGVWSLVGSANWDQRSLRLNFEFNVECYDQALAARLDRLIDDKLARSRRLRPIELYDRPLFLRLRDGLAWLLSPYL
jgi:cardiolipin synthase